MSAVAGDGQATVSWIAPAWDGSVPIDHYVVTAYVDGVAQPPVETSDVATSYVVTGLTNGTAYTFTVAAHNSLGTGLESARSCRPNPLDSLMHPPPPTRHLRGVLEPRTKE